MYKIIRNRYFELTIDTASRELRIGMKYHHGFYFTRNAKLSFDLWPISLFVNMPCKSANLKQANQCEWPSYGFLLMPREVHLKWGTAYKIVHFPWDWDWVRTSTLKSDGTWSHKTLTQRLEPNSALDSAYPYYNADADKSLFREEHPYTYTLRSGVQQKVTATIRVSECEWRMRWLKWLPWPRKLHRGIDINFSDEIGERAGSWSCSYNMLKGETPLECLRRMEKERTF